MIIDYFCKKICGGIIVVEFFVFSLLMMGFWLNCFLRVVFIIFKVVFVIFLVFLYSQLLVLIDLFENRVVIGFLSNEKVIKINIVEKVIKI